MDDYVEIVVWDQPASKSNQRINLRTGQKCPVCKLKKGAIMSIKSKKARAFMDSAREQVAPLDELLTGELRADIAIWYRNQLSDLDESVVLDVLQGILYENDRQIRERHVYHAIDKENPHVRVRLTKRTPGTLGPWTGEISP
jgi:Holliday junction resolvase RusA-like endonuclease